MINHIKLNIKVIRIALVLVCLVFLTVLFLSRVRFNQTKTDFVEILSQINTSHYELTCKGKEVVDITAFQYKLPENERGFSDEEIDLLVSSYGTYPTQTNKLPVTSALQDVDLLYKLLKYFYAGYQVFGGDEVFPQKRASLEASIKEFGEALTVGDFEKLLHNNLSFIQDGHFAISSISPLKHYNYFTSEENEFYRDAEGFYMLKNNAKNYVTAINNDKEIEGWMKLSASPEGLLTYYLGTLSDQAAESMEIAIQFEKEHIQVSLYKAEPVIDAYNPDKLAVSSQNKQIPIARIETFKEVTDIKKLGQQAQKLRDSNVGILDIRGNTGGHPRNVKLWLDLYNPNQYEPGMLGWQARNMSLDACELIIHIADFFESRNDKNMPEVLRYFETYSEQEKGEAEFLKGLGKNSWISSYTKQKHVANDRILFVLMDYNSMSAAELLIGKLHYQDNVIFVGTNSAGVCTFGNYPIVLPNSKMNIVMGNNIFAILDGFEEGRGFCPDIWIIDNALERLLRLVKKYDL